MKKAILTFVALAATTGFAFADGMAKPDHGPGPGQGPHGPFEMLKDADTNKDGKVSLDEFKAFANAKADERFKHIDTNGDGVISREEFAAANSNDIAKTFERLDVNKDGVIDEADQVAMRGQFREHRGHEAPPPGHGQPEEPAGAPPAQ